ncbi:MAG: hypothetical protein HRT45_14910 [Bdellovibrionales bacterium]|nr:hypothetical protein [Bdellovibrionales bacterium]
MLADRSGFKIRLILGSLCLILAPLAVMGAPPALEAKPGCSTQSNSKIDLRSSQLRASSSSDSKSGQRQGEESSRSKLTSSAKADSGSVGGAEEDSYECTL